MKRTVRSHLAPTRERRDPQAATRNPTWYGKDQPMVPEWAGDQAFRYGVMANVVAFRCIQVWADAVAKYPFRAGPTPPARPGLRSDFNPNARLAQLLGPPTRRVGNRLSGPNPEMTGRTLLAWTAAQRIATGRNAWEIEWTQAPGKGEVAALWPLPACHVRPIPTAGRSARYFDGFRVETDPAEVITLRPEQVHYGWTMSGTDPRQAVAPLQASRYAITLAVMGDRQNLAFLRNGAVPAAIVTTEAFPNDDERAAFQKQWANQYRGPDKAGATAFHEASDQGEGPVGEAIDVKVLGLSNRDSQFVQAHLQSLKEIAWGLGVPWSKIDAADRTFANADAEERIWLTERVVPFLETLADEINLRLAPMLGSEVGWFDLSDEEALRPRPKFTAAEGVTLWSAGLALAEEVREEVGLDPDVELPAPVVPEQPALPPAPVTVETPVVLDGAELARQSMALHQQIEDGRGKEATRALAPKAIMTPTGSGSVRGPSHPEHEARALTAEQQEQRRATIWKRNDAALRGLEARFARAWADYFKRQAKAVVGQLTGKRTATRLTAASHARELRADLGIGGPLDPAEIARWRAAAMDLADLMHTAATTAGVTRVNNAFGVSFDLEAPFVQDFIRARANQLAGQVTDTTYTAIQQALADGVANGASIDDLATAVQDVFDVASRSRAQTIARTEVISASNGSASLAAAQLPADVAAGQEWISTRDDRTRNDHADADGQVVAMGAPFDVGGESLLYPGDPDGDGGNVINCFPADTIVASDGIEGSYSRWYEGEMVRVTTRSGGVLTGTPNHPVLTDRGWVGLGALNVADYLVRAAVGSLGTGAQPDVQRAPSPIGEVHDALTLASRAHRMRGAHVDFHGDGRESDVDVVRTARLLKVGHHAASAEQGRQPDLAVADLLERAFGRVRLPGELVGAGLAASPGRVGSRGEALALVGGGVRHADRQGLTPVARLDASGQKATTDGGAPHAEVGGDGLLRLASEVSADEIVHVERVPYSGHVFNLQTTSGWYIANGIVAHNCRCTVAFLTPKDMEGRARPQRAVPLRLAKFSLRTIRTGGDFDELEFRRSLQEAAA